MEDKNLSKKDRTNFVFFRNWYEAYKNESKQSRLAMYEAIITYMFDDEYEPNLPKKLKKDWLLIKASLDKSFKNWQNAKKK